MEDDCLALVQSGLVCGHPAPGLALTTGDPGQQQGQEEIFFTLNGRLLVFE